MLGWSLTRWHSVRNRIANNASPKTILYFQYLVVLAGQHVTGPDTAGHRCVAGPTDPIILRRIAVGLPVDDRVIFDLRTLLSRVIYNQ